ncbi:MAG: hypothetical protein WA126_14590 [Thermodesulfovibrionales bacterium]
MLIKYIYIIVSICFVIPVKAGIHFFLLDSGWSLSMQVVSREPAGMTTLKVFSGQ